jgi:hypothetical protein
MPTYVHINSEAGDPGDGSEGSPFRGTQVNPGTMTQSEASAAIDAPDTHVICRGHFQWNVGTGTNDYMAGALCPGASGTANAPIIFKPYDLDEPVIFETLSGNRPTAGNTLPNLTSFSHVIFEDLEFRRNAGNKQALIRLTSTGSSSRHVGNIVRYCRLIGSEVTTSDNSEALRIDFGEDFLVSFCEIKGATSTSTNHNDSGIKLYFPVDGEVSDCWVHDNGAGLFCKDDPTNLIYTRNYLHNNRKGDIWGTEYVDCHSATITQNIIGSPIRLSTLSKNYTITKNVIFGSAIATKANANTHGLVIHSNILIAPTDAPTVFESPYHVHPNESGFPDTLTTLGPNLVISERGGTPVPSFVWKGGNKSLAQMVALGYAESSALYVSGGRSAIFDDPTLLTLKAPYLTAGLAGIKPGPDDPATILDTTRYGPRTTAPEPEPDPEVPVVLLLRLANGNVLGFLQPA